MQLTRGKQNRPQRLVIYGPEGIGKSSLAQHLPKPVFIDTEGSTAELDVMRTPDPIHWNMLLEIIRELQRDSHGAETVVVDTVDWAETMADKFLCHKYNKDSIRSLDYGKGYCWLLEQMRVLLDELTTLQREQGVHLCLIAHATMRKFEHPEGNYDRWELKLTQTKNNDIAGMVKEWATDVLFCNYEVHVVEIDGSKKGKGGKRVIHCVHHPAWDAKNRHYLPDTMDMPADRLPKELAAVFASQVEEKDQTESKPAPKPETATESKPAPNVEDPDAFDPQLYNMLEKSQVTEEELQTYLREKLKITTSIHNLKASFVQRMLQTANWNKVLDWIGEYRKRKESAA